jgi:hypothetical protein
MLTKTAHLLKTYSLIKSEVPTLNRATDVYLSRVYTTTLRLLGKRTCCMHQPIQLIYPSETSLLTIEKLLTPGNDTRNHQTDTLSEELLSFKSSTYCQS